MFHREAILKLMEAVDDYFPPPQRALDRPFSLPVEDVFSIQGRGTVVTGRIEQGIVKTGEEVEIVGINPSIKSTVTGEVVQCGPPSKSRPMQMPQERPHARSAK